MNAGVDDFYYLDYSKMTDSEIDALLKDCFLQTLDMCRFADIDESQLPVEADGNNYRFDPWGNE